MVYEKVDAAWKQACRILLGDEIGELEEYEKWLSRYMTYPVNSRPSALSGKPVSYSVPNYPASARLVSLDEVDFGKRFEPLGINEIKDIDSIIGALRERICYTGNVILENSRFVAQSSTVSNSFYVFHSNFIDESKYMAYCTQVRLGENMYGVNNAGCPRYIISGVNVGQCTRCLEAVCTDTCSDCWYIHNAENCMNAMFCFNIKGKRNVIGNLELSLEKFRALQSKLLEDIRGELRAKKALPSLVEFPHGERLPPLPELEAGRDKGDKAPVEAAFGKVTSVVVGRRLHDMDSYEDWLTQFVKRVSSTPSAVSGAPVHFCRFYPYAAIPPGRFLNEGEAVKLGETLRLSEEEVQSLGTLRENLWKIAFFCPEGRFRKNTNMVETGIALSSSNCYRGGLYIHNEYCGFSYWSRNSRYMFGCEGALTSQSCIHAYHSVDLARCFEVDSCSTSSDLYFSHNCENVNDSMFTFNVKNLRYAIGNVQVGPEKYRPLKKSILEQIADELEAKKSFRWNIYNLAGT